MTHKGKNPNSTFSWSYFGPLAITQANLAAYHMKRKDVAQANMVANYFRGEGDPKQLPILTIL